MSFGAQVDMPEEGRMKDQVVEDVKDETDKSQNDGTKPEAKTSAQRHAVPVPGQLYSHQYCGYYSLPLSFYPPAAFCYVDTSTQPDPLPERRRNRGGAASGDLFPIKLHKMLEAVEDEGKTDVVSFCPHGRAFIIHKPRRFASEIMPRFFRQTKLTSFQRQLNLYNFKRISSGVDNGAYWGRVGLCVNMRAQKVKGENSNKRGPMGDDPNFYAYPPVAKDNLDPSLPPRIPQQLNPGLPPILAGYYYPPTWPYGYMPLPGLSPPTTNTPLSQQPVLPPNDGYAAAPFGVSSFPYGSLLGSLPEPSPIQPVGIDHNEGDTPSSTRSRLESDISIELTNVTPIKITRGKGSSDIHSATPAGIPSDSSWEAKLTPQTEEKPSSSPAKAIRGRDQC